MFPSGDLQWALLARLAESLAAAINVESAETMDDTDAMLYLVDVKCENMGDDDDEAVKCESVGDDKSSGAQLAAVGSKDSAEADTAEDDAAESDAAEGDAAEGDAEERRSPRVHPAPKNA